MPNRFNTFDPEQAAAMSAAFTAAWKSLTDSGSLMTVHNPSRAREALAIRIIETGKSGEYDVQRLSDDALIFLANPESVKRA